MKLYAFASSSLTNIWAGVGAQLWAVPRSKTASSNAGKATKAAKMSVGSLGILYSSVDKCFTTPFVVQSNPDRNRVIEHIWEGPWILPFAIKPIGNPHLRLQWEEAKLLLPSCISGQQLNSLIHVEPLTVFAASEVSEADWSVLVSKLGHQ